MGLTDICLRSQDGPISDSSDRMHVRRTTPKEKEASLRLPPLCSYPDSVNIPEVTSGPRFCGVMIFGPSIQVFPIWRRSPKILL